MLSANYDDLLARFLRYVAIDTQSDPESKSYPSTAKQLDLLRLLQKEAEALGLSDVELDKYGYLTASLPSNVDHESKTVAFIAHVDTSPELTGKNVKAIVHKNYSGQDIVLPDRPDTVIRYADNEALHEQIGNDIVTASGTTLLGADNKAGVAAIMTAMQYLIENPDIKHGVVKIVFTPDEEIGNGTKYFDIKKLAAYCAYTIDSSTRGMLDTETFSADAMSITFEGNNTHPGHAYKTMINAIKLAANFIERLPKDGLAPETTRDREGFVHPIDIRGGVDTCTLQFILRDFDEKKLIEEKDLLLKLADETITAYPGSKYSYTHETQYRNMKSVLDQYPKVVSNAQRAIREAGLELRQKAVRGGTDGSQLSLNGLPTPNIFAGEHNYHSRYEWVSVQDMLKSAEVIVRLSSIWSEV